jgi:hypothetical protein
MQMLCQTRLIRCGGKKFIFRYLSVPLTDGLWNIFMNIPIRLQKTIAKVKERGR